MEHQLCLLPCESKGTIHPDIYGHFTEHIGGVFRDGLWVGEDSEVENIHGFRKFIIEKMKQIHPSVVRFPGGCFAETYDWRDGIGPRAQRPKTMGWWYNNDHRIDTNEVGTHEFVDFCRLVGAEPYIAANITSNTPLEMRNWMEYCSAPAHSTSLSELRAENGSPEPFDVPYWGIGNENWGGGGNMTPQQYAREFIRYATVCQSVNTNDAKYIACGANASDVSWTEGFMREYAHRTPLYGLSFHYYCGSAGDVTHFTEAEWYQQLEQASFMETLIERHDAAMITFDPEKKVKIIVDEWGCWHPDGCGPSKGYNLFEQQSTMRDAMVTALTLNIFNNHCDRVVMTNVAQLCNNLHCLFLTAGKNAIVTPTYWVFDLFKGHQNGKQMLVAGVDEKLSVSASEKDGKITVTVCNLSYDEATELDLSAFGANLTAATITSLVNDPHAHNTFEQPDTVQPEPTKELSLANGHLTVTLAPASIHCIEILTA